MSAKNLKTVSASTLNSFLNSFYKVICDCDGVVWKFCTPIAGAIKTLIKLRQCGKEIYFATNNSQIGMKNMCNIFSKHNFDIHIESIAYPSLAIIDYFKQTGYNKSIFLIGSFNMKQELIDAGFAVAHNEAIILEEDVVDLLKQIEDDEDIGAVIVDVDVGINLLKLYKASIYLKRPEVIFIAGATTRTFNGLHSPIIGPSYFQDMLAEFTGRVPLHFGKPGPNFNKYLTKKFNITKPSRTLFIGDSLLQDMEFATSSGYQKLLVLSGSTSMDDLTKCTDKCRIPDFYIHSLGDLHDFLSKRLNI